MKMGELNFILEDLINNLADVEKMDMEDILKLFASELTKYPKSREKYEDGGYPKFYIVISKNEAYEYRISKRKNSRINKRTLQECKALIKEYVKNQELQWGEILYVVYGYICIHRPDIKNNDFFYGEY